MNDVDLVNTFARNGQLTQVDGERLVSGTKNVVHNTRYGVEQAERASNITHDALVASALASGRPEIASAAIAAGVSSVALSGAGVALEETEKGLDQVFPNIPRSSQQIQFTEDDLRKSPLDLAQKAISGFVEGDISGNEIKVLEEAERYEQDVLQRSGVIGEPVRQVRDVREAVKSGQRQAIQATGETVRRQVRNAGELVRSAVGLVESLV